MYWDDICITWEAYRRRETKGFHGQSSIVHEKNEAAIFELNTLNTSESQRVRPRPSDHRMFGDLELSHQDPAGVRAYFRVEASTFVTMSP